MNDSSRGQFVILRNITNLLENRDRVICARVNGNVYRQFKEFCKKRGLKIGYLLNLLMLSCVYGRVELPHINININLNIVKAEAKNIIKKKNDEIDFKFREIREEYEKLQEIINAFRSGRQIVINGFKTRPSLKAIQMLAKELLQKIIKFEKKYAKKLDDDILNEIEKMKEFLREVIK